MRAASALIMAISVSLHVHAADMKLTITGIPIDRI